MTGYAMYHTMTCVNTGGGARPIHCATAKEIKNTCEGALPERKHQLPHGTEPIPHRQALNTHRCSQGFNDDTQLLSCSICAPHGGCFR